ncbi:ABC transporter ATP-binding protein [Acidilutibacter cellobiosedens]|uniref:ABC transporter ATP-binding protein n=1 Tax=Acidilutibacter cellobiosedens TaxID=2507161 RepID=A0A410Q8V6_9FIRM|nr:ABC transporter ATP-binding protein [Acidilutibacter cellobiosedens]MBE6082996.1 ATP-binding cassette domain-containing protein [Tissierellaceae bacterium]QAT60412.1 ABC transporter ATP-binding protein [Acidilutibacter cellobiosedens]
MNERLLEVNNLQTYFYTSSGVVKAVDGVSFSLKKGQTLGIVGESGSGKSVTASSIVRLVPSPPGKIAGGEIIFDGKDILKLSRKELLNVRGRDIAMIFQDPMTALNPVFTIGKQISEAILVHRKISKDDAKKLTIQALETVGISDAESRYKNYPFEFSGGMRQRAMIAMAIVCNPKLLIADEPTTALDVTIQAQVLELMKNLQKELNTSILIITHDLGVIWEMADYVMVMYAGKTVEYTDMINLYKNPKHPYTWGLLDSIPKRNSEKNEPLNTIEGNPPDLRNTGVGCNFAGRCPYAKDICSKKQPPLIELETNHFVACHFQTKKEALTRRGDI